MLIRRACLLLLLFCLPALMAQNYGSAGAHVGLMAAPPAAAGGGGTDFTANSGTGTSCLGAWLLTSTGTSAAHADNKCVATGASHDLVWQGTGSVFNATPPVGTAAGQFAVNIVSNLTENFQGDDGLGAFDAFDALNTLTGICWVNHDSASVDVYFTKNDVTNWELGIFTHRAQFEINDVQIRSTSGDIPQDTWVHTVLRYDGDGSEPDATENFIEVILNGLEVASVEQTTGPTGNNSNLVIGADQNGSTDYGGPIMECSFYGKALSNEEIIEFLLCGQDGTADGEARDGAYGLDSCIGAGDPWPCCTGVDTGTCAGCDDISTCC